MGCGWLNPRMAIELRAAIPILRMHDVAVTKRFYLDYLGCTSDGQDGEGDRPIFMKVSRGGMRLHLSSHHDDGTPGTAVLVVTWGVAELHAELAAKNHPFLNPGLEPGPRWRRLRVKADRSRFESAALLRAARRGIIQLGDRICPSRAADTVKRIARDREAMSITDYSRGRRCPSLIVSPVGGRGG